MGESAELISTIALTLGVAWASGINLYAAIAVLGLGSATGYVQLPAAMAVVSDPIVIFAACGMYCVEFLADKTPGVDTAWDAVHTFIRIPAGALLAAGAVGDVAPALTVAAGLMGGTVSGVTHATKAGARVMINTSPEPLSNWGASLTEDVVVIGGLWAALANPLLFLVAFVLFCGALVWLWPRLWAGIGHVFRRLQRWLGISDLPREHGPIVATPQSTSTRRQPAQSDPPSR